MAESSLAGAVLVGGRSQRMGRDKARLKAGVIPLWQNQIRILRAAGASPVILALRPRQRSFGGAQREVRDSVAGAGPIGGLHAALAASTAPWLAVLAVDMPLIDAAWYRRLKRHCRPGVGAVAVEPEGYQPLAAIYPRSALEVAQWRLGNRQFALKDLVEELVRRGRMVAVHLPSSQRWRAANWNTPGDVTPRAARRTSVSLRRKSSS